MEDLNFNEICRICLQEGNMMSVFKVSMYKKMMAIASVQVWPNDGLPSQICAKCASKLHIAFQLRKQCEKSDLKLRQYHEFIKKAPVESKTNNNSVKQSNAIEGQITSNITQQPETQEINQRLYIQSNNSINRDPIKVNNENYDHFLVQNPPLLQISYTNMSTPEGPVQVPVYSIPGPQDHLIYNSHTSYPLPQEQIQAQPDHNMIQLTEINTPPPIQIQEKIEQNTEKLEVKKELEAGNHGSKTCPTCGKEFKTNVKLNRHMKIHRPNELPHKCPICSKGFSHKGNFTIHLRIHSNERPFKCMVCHKGCRQAQDLEKHMRTHTGEKPHKCTFCPRAFATSSNLTAHIRTHTGERPYVCCVCQKAFCQSNELTKHMRTHTGEKSHVCDICNKGFNGSSGLVVHRRKHTEENQQYYCPECNKSFKMSTTLYQHIKSHHKEHCFKCDHCAQVYGSLAGLRDHLTSHLIGGFIQCTMCKESFRDIDELLVHVKVHREVGD
ncbi:zinc finger protein 629-like [Anthonomus grandis grandis]|uniref:zinc finger protein 629-like n=1 Tax=Anthonomus grandis grandis TaxID=2921223 RepID=UPI0021662137|nr:zinc finger protein 629-like [Anthonomus grandis grandis]